MGKLQKSHRVLIAVAILVLVACIAMTVVLLFSNYRNVRTFKAAQDNFRRGDLASLELAEAQLHEVIRNDADNEAAYLMLAELAASQKKYPEQVYYSYMAHRLNPLSRENREQYVRSLGMARYFDRLENFLAQQSELTGEWKQLLLYAAGRNGNIHKYRFAGGEGSTPGALAELLFRKREFSAVQKLAELEKFSGGDEFLRQEVLAARAELNLAANQLDATEAALKEAYGMNEFAFAPALGRFYANFRSFGQALPILEKYLSLYHDPAVALQTAEIYCLLNRLDKITELRDRFQADSGNVAMLCCYYFDALKALATNDMASLKELTVPLRKSIRSQLAAFMFLCVDMQSREPAAIHASYSELLTYREYLDLQRRADEMVSAYLKSALAGGSVEAERYISLATLLYSRKPEAFTAKFILLSTRGQKAANISLLKEAMTRFGDDPGIVKIAIEHYIQSDPGECERLIAEFRKKFPEQAGDMLRYELQLAYAKKDLERASELFRSNFIPELRNEYWEFALASSREVDLRFLAKDSHYEPFCLAQLAIMKGENEQACRLLEKADARNNDSLLFFAARTLAENNRNQAALEKYALFSEDSPYWTAVLMNISELYAENGNAIKALEKARQAYKLAPSLPEAQLCYAGKLAAAGMAKLVPDVIKLSAAMPYKDEMEKLWIAGMQQRIIEFKPVEQTEKLREMCRLLLTIDAGNRVALETLEKLNRKKQ